MIRLGLIPAKGRSERLPGKNLRLLGGKSLLAWTIEAARKSGVCDELWVSSESAEVLDLAVELRAHPLRRPRSLSAPAATIADVTEHARRALEWRGPILILAPTNPFRTPEGIRAAWRRFTITGAGLLLSFSPMPHPPEWAWRFTSTTGACEPLHPDWVNRPRSDLPPSWRPDGCHVIVGGREGDIVGIESDPIEAVDIDTPEDLAYAESLLAAGRVPA